MKTRHTGELSLRHWSIGKDVGIVRGKYKGKSARCTILRWLEKSIEVDILLSGTMEMRKRVLLQSSLDLEDLRERYASHREYDLDNPGDGMLRYVEGERESIDSTILRLARMTIIEGRRCEDIQRELEQCYRTITRKEDVSGDTMGSGE